jgi:hypothetical protein
VSLYACIAVVGRIEGARVGDYAILLFSAEDRLFDIKHVQKDTVLRS